jgi:hypothetical protein
MRPITYWLSIWIFGIGAASIGAASIGAAPAPQSADELLSRLEARAAQLLDYQVKAETSRRGQTIHLKLYFKQPNLVRIDTSLGQVAVQPDGEIRGRLGKGPLGKDSEKIDRNDPRLRDAQGTPFYEMYFGATLARIRAQIKAGASATAAMKPAAPTLEVRSGATVWTYVVDPDTLFFREIDCIQNGRQVDAIRYSSFQPNLGLETRLFQF